MKSTAILARTNLALRIFEQGLADAGVPFHLVGKSGFYAQPEIRSSLSYAQCAVFPSDYALAGAIRAPLWPSKYLPKSKLTARLKEIQQDPEEGKPSYLGLLTQEPHTLVETRNLSALQEFTRFVISLSRYRDLAAGEAVKQILAALKAFDHFAEEEATPDNDPVLNLTQLAKIAGRFGTLKEFLDYARKVSAASKRKTGVALSTVHAFKGLQATTVYVVQVSEGVLPHAKSNDLDSERNVWFTAISRAERELVITYSGQPSVFLEKFTKKNSG
jgi:DNA helicase-2/ATP-dependent DNA helicase PcrA